MLKIIHNFFTQQFVENTLNLSTENFMKFSIENFMEHSGSIKVLRSGALTTKIKSWSCTDIKVLEKNLENFKTLIFS